MKLLHNLISHIKRTGFHKVSAPKHVLAWNAIKIRATLEIVSESCVYTIAGLSLQNANQEKVTHIK